MKTKFILFLLLFSAAMFAQEVKRVAILETVDKENKVSYANKLILRASLSKAITQTEGYEAYDRTDVDAIMSEQDFQRTGMVSNDQIKRLGEMTGANYILVAEAVQVDNQNMFITAKLLDVETARTIMTDNVMMGTTAEDIQAGCKTLSEKLFSNTPTNKTSTSKTSSKVASKASATQIPEMSNVEIETEMLVINSKSDQKLLGAKLVKCLKNGISILSMHLNLDVAKDGIDESLMAGILSASGETDGAGMRSNIKIMHPMQESGYGRVYSINAITLGELYKKMKKVFSSERMLAYGKEEKEISCVASFCGAGGDEEAVLFAKNNGADVVVSADFKHHVIAYALELGLSVITMTHYASENYGFKKYYEKIRQQVKIPCAFHTDEHLL